MGRLNLISLLPAQASASQRKPLPSLPVWHFRVLAAFCMPLYRGALGRRCSRRRHAPLGDLWAVAQACARRRLDAKNATLDRILFASEQSLLIRKGTVSRSTLALQVSHAERIPASSVLCVGGSPQRIMPLLFTAAADDQDYGLSESHSAGDANIAIQYQRVILIR